MKDLINWIYAIIGIVLAVGSALNEGIGTGAWAGVVYALAFGIIIGFGEKLMRQISWKTVGLRCAFCVAAAIVAAIACTFI